MGSDSDELDTPRNEILQRLPIEIMQDIAVRFLLNLPEEEMASWERIMSHAEEAYYFYCDQIVPAAGQLDEDKYAYTTITKKYTDSQTTGACIKLQMRDIVALIHAKYAIQSGISCTDLFPYLSFEAFTTQIFSRILHLELEKIMDGLKWFSSYKNTVNVCGVVLLNPRKTHVLAVSARAHSRLYFPKGKIMKNESDYECALREAREEIGVDLTPYLAARPIVAKHHKNFPPCKFFVAVGPWESADVKPFVPQCKGEIQEVRWVDIDLLRTEYFRRGIAYKIQNQHAKSMERNELLEHIERESRIRRKECPFDPRRLGWMVNYYEEICSVKSM